jgi:DNA polymerase elongation subunit (family B)
MNKFYTNVQCSGNKILVKEVVDGKRRRFDVPYKPTLYVQGNKNSQFHTLDDAPVEPLKFDSIKEAREFLKINEGVQDYPIYGNTQYQYAYIADNYPEHEINYNLKDIAIYIIDIENENENTFTKDASDNALDRINVITLKNLNEDFYYVFTFADDEIYNKNNRYKPGKNIKHYEFESEEEMLLGFLDIWRKLDPDIITGWNSRFYDLPYLYNRLVLLFNEKTAKRLSPWNNVQAETVNFMNQDRNCYAIAGISQLDYLQLYKKNVMDPRENYKLDFIAKTELKGIGKLDWQEKYNTMKDFYTKDFQMFVEYNTQDVHLIDLLEEKRKLLELVIDVAYIAKVNYVDVLAQTRTWDILIYNWLKQENIVIPQKDFQEKTDQFVGAYVKDPKPGMYYNVVSFDVASLYPNIIRVLNIGPETKQPKFKTLLNSDDVLSQNVNWKNALKIATDNGCTLASNGVFYSKIKQSFYSRMIAVLFDKRKGYQKRVRDSKIEIEEINLEIQKRLNGIDETKGECF